MSRAHRLRWFPQAYDDLRNARDWYEEQSAGLGADFVAEFWQTVAAIDRFPLTPRVLEIDGSDEQLRRWHFGASWPFSILYLVEDDLLIFVAVAHDRRNPPNWSDRLRRK